MSLDSTIQKYLTGHIEPSEKEWLLSEMLKFYNEILLLMEKWRRESLPTQNEARLKETRWDG